MMSCSHVESKSVEFVQAKTYVNVIYTRSWYMKISGGTGKVFQEYKTSVT